MKTGRSSVRASGVLRGCRHGEPKTMPSLRTRKSRNMMAQTMLLLLSSSFIFVDVRCPRPHSLLGCVLYDVPNPHSCALVGHVSDGEFILPATADELAVVAEGLIEGHPLAAATVDLR